MKRREIKVGPHTSSRTEDIILGVATALANIGKG